MGANKTPSPQGGGEGTYGLLVGTIVYQFIHHRGVGEVAEVAQVILGDLAQDAAHDLAGAGLGQARGKLDHVRFGDGTDLLHAHLYQFFFQFIVGSDAEHRSDVGVNPLALDLVRVADHRGFGNLFVQDQGAFHFGGAHAMAGDVEYVVHSPGNPVVTVLVAARAVATEVVARVLFEIGLHETLVIAVHRAHLARPGPGDDQRTGGLGVLDELASVGIHDAGYHAEERRGGGTGFHRGRAGQARDQMAAGFRLPPGIDNGATPVTDHVVIPFPSLGVDGFAHGAEQAQGFARGLFHRAIAFAHQCADRGRRGVEHRDLVLVADLPETRGVGIVGHALEGNRGGADGQRSVHQVAMAGHPAHVGGTPVDVAFLYVKGELGGHGCVQQVSGGGVQHALGFAGGAGGIQDKQRIFGIHGFRRAVGRGAGHGLVVPDVDLVVPGNVAAGAPDREYGVYVGTIGYGLFGVVLERHVLAAAHALVGGDHDTAIGVENAILERLRREAAEHYRVHGTDARAGEHGVGRFRDHRHVDADAIAFFDAAGFQDIGQFADFLVQLFVGDVFAVLGVVTFPDDGGLVAAFFQVSIDAVIGDVEFAALEPFDVQVVLVVTPVADLVPLLVPAEIGLGLFGPEAVRVLDRTLVHFLVLLLVDVGFGGKGRGYCVDLVGHESSPVLTGGGVRVLTCA